MKRLILGVLLVVLAGLALCTQAQAVTLTPDSLHDPATVHALNVAERYWRADPDCPSGITVTTYDGTYSPTAGAVAGIPGSAVAASGDCAIWLNSAWWWPRFDGWPVEYCRTIVHEWGHLVLGDSYFQAVNPADPSHSPDPHSIMYYAPTYVPSGCTAHSAKRKRHRVKTTVQRGHRPR